MNSKLHIMLGLIILLQGSFATATPKIKETKKNSVPSIIDNSELAAHQTQPTQNLSIDSYKSVRQIEIPFYIVAIFPHDEDSVYALDRECNLFTINVSGTIKRQRNIHSNYSNCTVNANLNIYTGISSSATAQLISIETGAIIGTANLAISPHYSRLSPDGSKIAYYKDSILFVTNVKDNNTKIFKDHNAPITDIAFATNNDIASVGADMKIFIYDSERMEKTHEFQTYEMNFLEKLAVSTMLLLQVDPKEAYYAICGSRVHNSLAFIENDSMIASAGNDVSIRIFDLEQNKRTIEYFNYIYEEKTLPTYFSIQNLEPIGESLMAISYIDELYFWDIRRNAVRQVVAVPFSDYPNTEIDFTQTNKYYIALFNRILVWIKKQ